MIVPAAVLLVALAAPHPDPVFTVADPRLDEVSGMVDLGHGLTVLTDDSGDTGRVFVLDAAGRTVGVTGFGSSVDAEALAPAVSPGDHGAAPTVSPGDHGETTPIWVGDIGDNNAARPYVVLRRVPVGRGDRNVRVPAYRLVYPDGPHDAETLLRDPRTDRLYVVTKSVLGGGVYAVPQPLSSTGTNRLRKLAKVSIFATDGAFLSGGRRVLIRGYGSANLYSFPSLRLLRSFAVPAEPQGESLSVGPGDRIRVTSEGAHQPVLAVSWLRAVATPDPTPAQPTAPARADDTPAVSTHDGAVDENQVVFWSVFAAVGAGLAALAAVVRRRGRSGT